MAKTLPEVGRHCSVFDLPSDFFKGCFLLSLAADAVEPRIHATSFSNGESAASKVDDLPNISDVNSSKGATAPSIRLTCNTCKADFESLQDQRFHFKSDIHRLNVKLTIAGKEIIKEDEFDKLAPDSFDVSSVSGSEDEADDAVKRDKVSSSKKKVILKLSSGDRVSLWKCLLLSEGDFEEDESRTVINRLSELSENRDGANLRIVLLARGGHFAGCVFDGSSVVAHKTFHRYVVRAKAGKKQSSKDASGRFAHSAGAALRRYNELGLKKDIQELLYSWKQYFERCSCVFVHAPSSNRQLLYDGDKPYFSCKAGVIRNIPITVRRPTFKESKNVYAKLTQLEYEPDEVEEKGTVQTKRNRKGEERNQEKVEKDDEVIENGGAKDDDVETEEVSENKTSGETTPLHEAAKGGDSERTTELLENGFDPCAKDERGRTPYMVATQKEVRNAFRRFMALNPEKWDWNAAKVPSGLTKEMEESQAAKLAEKEAKKKARNKELKKLRKARDKKAQAHDSSSSVISSKEDEAKRKIEEDREKRAAAAERRMAAASKGGESASDMACSLCSSSLKGIVPFHRYNFNYCSSSCMHVHKEILESE